MGICSGDSPDNYLTNSHVNEFLKVNGINVQNKTSQGFLKDNWTDYSSLFNLLVTDPPEASTRSYIRHWTARKSCMDDLSPEEILSIPNHGNIIQKSGEYIVIFDPFELLRDYYEKFLANGYNVVQFQYVIKYDHNTIPKHRLDELPQSCSDYLIIEKHRGDLPGRLFPDLDITFNILQ